MAITFPYTFANLSGNVPASDLDSNFTYTTTLAANATVASSLKAAMESKKSNKSTARVDVFGNVLDGPKPRKITFKVSTKGAITAVGVNSKWGCTLYAQDMAKL